jgi:hypothetical protein
MESFDAGKEARPRRGRARFREPRRRHDRCCRFAVHCERPCVSSAKSSQKGFKANGSAFFGRILINFWL